MGGYMSTCFSLKSPDVEYTDSSEISAVDSTELEAQNVPCVSDHKIVDTNANLGDPRFCATLACDIYKHLRSSEEKKRPATDFMEKMQKDFDASMRATLIDWLVYVAEEFQLVPETLYLAVNYMDRYLSGKVIVEHKFQLLGVACMLIASKYEEVDPPEVENFCNITNKTYVKAEVLKMEYDVLIQLKFDMAAPTTKCFLRLYVFAAQGADEPPLLQLECLSDYIAELSLLEYSMLCFAPSVIAASAIFLARFILLPSERPWNSTLRNCTYYHSSDLQECVMALHSLCCNSQSSTLSAIRKKYSRKKYDAAAKKYCPPSIPQDYFCNQSLDDESCSEFR